MWNKSHQAAMDHLSNQCQGIVPADVKAKVANTAKVTRSKVQTIPNRATHVGVLIEWATDNGYRLELVKA
jgi:hypothetical protein